MLKATAGAAVHLELHTAEQDFNGVRCTEGAHPYTETFSCSVLCHLVAVLSSVIQNRGAGS